MVMRSTRLEFLIVTTAFVILLLCSRPPRSGTAETTEPRLSNLKQVIPGAAEESEISNPAPVALPPSRAAEPAREKPTAQTTAAPVNAATSDSTGAPKPPTKRMASVDARNCPGLNYRDIMYGEVTVRWVWDGNKFVPHKVCVVKEAGGVTTVWSFNDPGGATLTEIGEVPADGQ